MITELRVRNFKRFLDSSFTFRPLTVFTGLNGTGKSSAIHALLLARQIAEAPGARVAQLNGPYGLALGEAQEVLCRSTSEDEVEIQVTGEAGPSSSYRFAVPEETLHLPVRDRPSRPMPELALEGSGFTYLCAERLGPRDILSTSAEEPERIGVGVQGEFTAQVLALDERGKASEVRAALRHPGASAITLRLQVEAWMTEIVRPTRVSTKSPDGITVSAIRFEEPDALGEETRPTNMGFGFSYTLPVVVAGLRTKPGDLLIVENPEAHLHPGGQSRMGRFLSRLAGSGVQVLTETHSDHVLNGIRLAASEDGTVGSEDVVIHYFDDEAPGSAPIGLTPSGDLTRWPDGFFDQIEQDLGRLARARRRGR